MVTHCHRLLVNFATVSVLSFSFLSISGCAPTYNHLSYGNRSDVTAIIGIERAAWKHVHVYDVTTYAFQDGNFAAAYFNIDVGPGTSIYEKIGVRWVRLAAYGTKPYVCQFTTLGIDQHVAEQIITLMRNSIDYNDPYGADQSEPYCNPLKLFPARRATSRQYFRRLGRHAFSFVTSRNT